MQFVMAQIMGLLGAGSILISTQMKNKNKYLLFNILASVFFIISMLLLQSFAGAVNYLIGMILTIISSKYEDKKFPIWMIIAFSVAILIGNIITYVNIYSLLPAIASYIYLATLISKDMKNVRRYAVVLRISWAIYDFIIMAYTTFILDLFNLGSTIIAIYRYDIKSKSLNKRKS